MSVQWQQAGHLDKLMLRCAFVGSTGSGKTYLCKSFPNPLFIFPRNEDSKTTLMGSNLPYTEIGSMAEAKAVLDQLVAMHARGDFRGAERTIVFENISHYSDIVEAELTRNGMVDIDWSKYNAHIKYLRDTLWSLSDCHVVLTLLDSVKTDKKKNVVSHGPKLFGQAGDTFLSSCTVVAYCDQEPPTPDRPYPRWVVHTQSAGIFSCRTRIPGMPPGIHESFQFGTHLAPYLPQYQRQQQQLPPG